MTTEQTITIHHEPPAHTMDGNKTIIAWSIHNKDWYQHNAETVKNYWGKHFTAWYDPQVGEPVKQRRYVVEPFAEWWGVADKTIDSIPAMSIPTREAAQAIADIYERAAEGGV